MVGRIRTRDGPRVENRWSNGMENIDFHDIHVCLLRRFNAHELDNNIGLKPNQWEVVV